MIPKVIYQLITYLLNLIDYVLGFHTQVELANPIKSVEVGGPAKPGEGRMRRSPELLDVKDLYEFHERKGRTMVELLHTTVSANRHRIAFAYRPVVALKTVGNGKMANNLAQLGRQRVITFQEFHDRVMSTSAGLSHLGLQPGDIVALYEETCVEWLIVAHAAWQHKLKITTVYANLGEDALHFALGQTKAKALFTSAKQVKLVAAMSDLEDLIAVIYNGQLESPITVSGKNVISISDLQKCRPILTEASHPSADDIACIMYTSGTTGEPKGVLLTHRNLVAAVVAMQRRIGLGEDLSNKSTVMFLPLAHIYSLVLVHSCMLGGAFIALGAPTTLTDTFVRPHGDLKEYRPSMLFAVPRVYDVFKKTIEAQLAMKSPMVRALFQAAYDARKAALDKGCDTPLWNFLVFRKLRNVFGGNLEVTFSGGAPLNAKTQEFIRVVLGVSIEQGYGLTETTACLGVQYKNDFSVNNVGDVHDPCEVKLVDIPDMGYTVNDKPNPRGEIWVRGPVVSPGYFNLPDKTAEVFHEGGWFATGDVGQWLPNGALQLIDRKKNLVKLAMGEYVALEKLESIYSSIKFAMPNGICCVADPEKCFPVALILVNKDVILQTARTCGWPGGLNDHLNNPALHRMVQEALDKEGDHNHLKPFEQVKRFRLYTDVWTPENGMLTAAMKLLRRNIEKHYAADIAAMYA